jgi:hypothetical protein
MAARPDTARPQQVSVRNQGLPLGPMGSVCRESCAGAASSHGCVKSLSYGEQTEAMLSWDAYL